MSEKKFRKLIEISQENLIECDNVECDYVIVNTTKDPNTCTKEYINKPCPECGTNLLTEKDYLDSLKIMKVIRRLNKWFSWLTIFIPRSKNTTSMLKIHQGVIIEKE